MKNKANIESLAIHKDIDYYITLVRQLNEERQTKIKKPLTAYTHTYGCQQNEADTETIDGLLLAMGYLLTDTPETADFVLYNTCAVREGAEDRVFGNVGALKQAKNENPEMIISLCGCMTQQEHIANRFKQSYPFVDLVFGAGAMHRLPELIYRTLKSSKRIFHLDDPTLPIYEGLPTEREGLFKAWLPIMSGCDNFCTYCVVPLVRGRERSRDPEDVIKEAQQLIADGYKEITLLGQNVNSYGKTLDNPTDFPSLLKEICLLPGDFIVRFMTSHPKDCTKELIDVVGTQPKMAKYLHLPVQSGSNAILKAMNRGYTREHYLSLIKYAKTNYPAIAFSSDIMVGFPGETYEDFKETLSLVENVQYASLFTFIYSKREGTKAATMESPIPPSETKKWFQELLDVQNPISQAFHKSMISNTYRVLLEGPSRTRKGFLSGRSEAGVIVDCKAPETLLGEFVDVKITEAQHWAVVGEIIETSK